MLPDTWAGHPISVSVHGKHQMPVKHSEFRSITDSDPAASEAVFATLSGRSLLPNTGIPLNLDWVRDMRVNTSAVERRTQSHVARRTVKKEWQAAWLLRAITCMDLTTLSAMTRMSAFGGCARRDGIPSKQGWKRS